MRIGKYNIRADSHQFILEEVKINSTVKDGVKGPNYGEEQLTNPCYPQSWEAVVSKLIKLELMASVKELYNIRDVTRAFEIRMGDLAEEANKQLGRKS